VPTGSILAFWSVALLLIIVPGADWAFTLGAGLRGRSVFPAVGGLVLGYAAMTVVVAGGVGAMVAGSPRALAVLSVVGGCYLVWHGARTFAEAAGRSSIATTGTGTGTSWAILAQGVGVSGLNPKGLLIFIALLPQFTSPAGDWPLAVQMGALGLVFVVTCAAFYSSLGSVARTILQSRPTAARILSRVSGAGMVVIGAGLIIERLV
jgi:threonine/homoserine/homoserine lactone efflux protein